MLNLEGIVTRVVKFVQFVVPLSPRVGACDPCLEMHGYRRMREVVVVYMTDKRLTVINYYTEAVLQVADRHGVDHDLLRVYTVSKLVPNTESNSNSRAYGSSRHCM